MKFYSIIILLGISMLFSGRVLANDYIKGKLTFYYFDTPATTSPTVIPGNNISSSNSSVQAFWNNSNVSKFHDLIKALVNESSNGGDPSLQDFVESVLKITDKPIQVRLWRDPNNVSSSSFSVSNKPCINRNHVWPCASMWSNHSQGWGGYMHIGSHYSDQYGLSWLKETFIHELMHTQDASLPRWRDFIYDNVNYRYGRDGTHFFTEVVPNKRMAYKEGLANAMPMLYQWSLFNRYFTKFKNNDYFMIETTQPSGFARALNEVFGFVDDDIWLYEQLREAVGNGSAVPGRSNYRRYRIRDIPPKFIVHNEVIIAMAMSMTSYHVSNKRAFIYAVKRTNRQASRNTDPLAQFIKNFAIGLTRGGDDIRSIRRNLDQTAQSTGAPPPEPYDFLLPLAYFDYFTGYSSNSVNELKALFENELDDDIVHIYWDHFKDNVRATTSISSSSRAEDLIGIAIQCGVTQCYVPGSQNFNYERNR